MEPEVTLMEVLQAREARAFRQQALLEECGWKVNIEPDINALTKLSTGSLAVWAAAWGSTIDPDMYQVYHKNSTATSVSRPAMWSGIWFAPDHPGRVRSSGTSSPSSSVVHFT